MTRLSENTNGLHLNVAAFDFAGLYPSMMISRNISWETKSVEPTEFGVNIATPRDFQRSRSESTCCITKQMNWAYCPEPF